MMGAIRKREILAHPFLTIRCFGWPLFLKALLAGREQTFLGVVSAPAATLPRSDVVALLGRCAKLELGAKRIYLSLAARFAGMETLSELFTTIAAQEQTHYEMLMVCRQLSDGWQEELFAPGREAVDRAEEGLAEAARKAEQLGTPHEALRLVVQMESSEINRILNGAFAATRSSFVSHVHTFQRATAAHIRYICSEIPKIDESLEVDCLTLLETSRQQ